MALARPCTGKRVQGSRQSHNQGGRNGLLQQPRNLRRGLHPKTGRLLPPPVPIDASSDAPPELTASYSSQAGRIYSLATPQTLSSSLQPMLARIRAREAAAADAVIVGVPLLKRRVSRKSAPGQDAATCSRNTLLLPTSSSSSVIVVEDG